MFFEVIPLEVFRLGSGTLTYSSDQNLLPGQLVLIPLGKKTITGIVFRRVKTVDFPTKLISRLITPVPIPSHILKAIFWLSEYYLTPLPTCANLFIPTGLAARTTTKYLESFLPTPTQNHKENQNSPLGPSNAPNSTRKTKSAITQPSSQKTPKKALSCQMSSNYPSSSSILPRKMPSEPSKRPQDTLLCSEALPVAVKPMSTSSSPLKRSGSKNPPSSSSPKSPSPAN